MHFSVSSVILTCLVSPLLGGVVPTVPQKCKKPLVRKEWRTLSKQSQLEYIGAVKCLQTNSPKFSADWPGARNRFDDFQGLHINQTDFIHFVGHFQPWHRWFVATYEKALGAECGYGGAQPYWDWTQDATPDKFPKAPVFDPIFGFGGNGPFINKTNPDRSFHITDKTGGGCVDDGPFKTMSVNMGPGNSTTYNPRCLTRDFAPVFATSHLNKTNVQETLQAKSFAEFDVLVQGGVTPSTFTYHGGGHLGVGGELGVIGDVYASPGDPLFFLHHANMDRIWWTWELSNRKARTQDIAGPSVQFTAPFDFFGPTVSPNITLDYVMNVRNFVPEGVAIKDVMDIQQGILCYDYDKLAV